MKEGWEKLQVEPFFIEGLELMGIDKSQIASTKLQINLNIQ
jgi:hypothetical protein